MQRKLLLEKKWEYNEVVHKLFKDIRNSMIQLEGKSCIIFINGIGIPMKLEVIKTCMNECYSRICVGK